MKIRGDTRPAPRHTSWRWFALGAIVLIVLLAGALWWSPTATGGRPRLTLDREVVDLGDLQFDTPARVVFTLSNAGDGQLKIAEELSVKAVKGC